MAATVTVRFWAGARRAAGHPQETAQARDVAELRDQLRRRAGLVEIALVASFLVDGVQAGEQTVLHDGAVVDVLPPFAGG